MKTKTKIKLKIEHWAIVMLWVSLAVILLSLLQYPKKYSFKNEKKEEKVDIIRDALNNNPKIDKREIEISAYSEIDSCHYPIIKNGERKCLTASGKIAEEGMVASNLYPFGTKLIINGQDYTVEDRISKRYNDRIDIFRGYGEIAYEQAINWGVKKMEIIILN